MAEATESKRTRKLQKEIDYEGGVVSITVISSNQTLKCDVKDLPKDIIIKLVPLALNHRIGDAAAGRDGEEAFESMEKVWKALVAGDFTVKAPPGSKLPSKKELSANIGNLPKAEQDKARALLAKIGVLNIG